MAEKTWNTAITNIKPNEIRLRGYRIDELMGELTFAQTIYLALMGELPEPNVAKLMDVILVSSIDHGATPPSALAARTSASTGAPLNAAIAAGVLTINDFHGGAIHNCMLALKEALALAEKQNLSSEKAAEQILAQFKTRKKRIAGFGHRIHTNDPRTKKLLDTADELGLAGKAVEMVKAIQKQFEKSGKKLPVNVDGAIASLLVDLNIPVEYANAFFIMARVPGIAAHVFEEKTTQKPMRKIDPVDHAYNGADDRSL